MTSFPIGMTPRLRSAIAQQTAAAEARDPEQLMTSSRAVVSAGWAQMSKVYGGTLTDRVIGSLLLTGRGSDAAATLQRAGRRFTDDGEEALSRIPEDEWNAPELTLLREIRLLSGEWRPLPGMPGRRDLRVLGSNQRRVLRHAQALFSACSERDAVKMQRAIAAIGRNDPAKFSVLAYALYRDARRRGFAVKVPRKYAF